MKFEIYAPVESIQTPFLKEANVFVDIKREDKIHPFISGNKWRKLNYNIKAYFESGKKGIVTFGGAYSNHLIATAAACASYNIPCVGIVRGDELSKNSNIVLRLCDEFGMELRFVPRSEYKLTTFEDTEYYTIPEGGANIFGVKGCAEIMTGMLSYDHVVVAVGTSTTFKGVIQGANNNGHIHGIAALKNAGYLATEVTHGTTHTNWTLHTQFCGKGFGKYGEEEVRFNASFAKETGILLDPVYTGKAMSAVYKLITDGVIRSSQRVLFIHTGGLTGILSDKWLAEKKG